MKYIIDTLSIPVMLMNIFSGIIGGIWLAILGEWQLIGIGIGLIIVVPWGLNLLLLISIPLVIFAEKLYNGKKYFYANILGFISMSYINILIIATCIFAWLVCSSYYSGDTSVGFIPYLLWSWGIALGPWQYLASREPDKPSTVVNTFFASLFYFLFIVSVFIHPLITLLILILFGIVHLIVLPIVFLRFIYDDLKNARTSY